LNSFEKTFWWSCKYKSRSKKFTCPFRLVPMKFHLSDGRITCSGKWVTSKTAYAFCE